MGRLNSRFDQKLILLIKAKHKKYRLFYALYIKYYELHGVFFSEIPKFSNNFIDKLSGIFEVPRKIYTPSAKALNEYRSEVRAYYDTSSITAEHESLIKAYVFQILPLQRNFDVEPLKIKVFAYLKQNKIESPSERSLNRVIKSAIQYYENHLFTLINRELSFESKAYLDGLMLAKDSTTQLSFMKRWPLGLSLKSILIEAEKLQFTRLLSLPSSLKQVSNTQLKKYYRNICSKYPSAIKEMPDRNKYALLAIFCFIRERKLNDNLVELLIRLTKKVFTSGANKLIKELSQIVEIKGNFSRKKALNILIDTIFANEDGIIKEVIYPVISKEKLEALRSGNGNKPITYNGLVYERARASYVHHYRRMLAPVLDLLEFNSNNAAYQPIIEALGIIKGHLSSNVIYYSDNCDPPINGAIKKSHQIEVLEENENGVRINRISYELSVLYKLRNKLRVKEIWVKNGYQYRNPEEDLPQDFEDRRNAYYQQINQPLDANKFIAKIKKALDKNLANFNTSLPNNKLVQILKNHKDILKLLI